MRRDSEQFPSDDAQAEMYLWTVDCLHRHGFFQYEISNFARTGFESRHNLKYWTLGGMGHAGAHSDFGNVRYAYEKDLDGYLSGMKAGGPLLSENERIPPLDRDTEWIMLGLRTVFGLDPYLKTGSGAGLTALCHSSRSAVRRATRLRRTVAGA